MYFISFTDKETASLSPEAIEYIDSNPNMVLVYGREPLICARNWQACQAVLSALPKLGCTPDHFGVSRRRPVSLKAAS